MKINSGFNDSKKHYLILDGLRGIAAITVVAFHLLEFFSDGDHNKQIINHGYLAVDFFFALSGFVIGYAYDDRWSRMSTSEFIKRRLIRLHPMIIVGMLIGAALFYFQVSPELFPKVGETPVWKMLLVMFIGFTLVPVGKGLDIRGWDEMYPLNGPAWSLFYEYIANICYALFLRKLSNKILTVLVVVAAVASIQFATTNSTGDLIGGWSFNAQHLQIGSTRLAYPFLAGLLLSRIFRPMQIKNALFLCSVLLIAVLSVPRIGHDTLWQNGLYDSLMVILIFPLIVYIGANGDIKGKFSIKICQFIGDISYPIYIIHYPFIYTLYAWLKNNNISMQEAAPIAALIWIAMVVLAYLLFKTYDVPVRKWLTQKFFPKKAAA